MVRVDVHYVPGDADGVEISGANFPAVVSVKLSQRDTTVHPTQLTGAVSSVVPVNGAYTLVTGADGTMSLMVDGSLVMQTVRAHLSDRVQAARLGDGRVATVGTDGYLRVWSVPGPGVLGLPTPFGFVTERKRMPSTTGVHIAPHESAVDTRPRRTSGASAPTRAWWTPTSRPTGTRSHSRPTLGVSAFIR